MATHMKGLMEQMHTMMKDQRMMKDPAMRHGMDAMQDHLVAMSKTMGKMDQAMEQMHKQMAAKESQPRKP